MSAERAAVRGRQGDPPFELLEAGSIVTIVRETGSIAPIVAKTFPLVEASKANELLERGGVVGAAFLVAPSRGPHE